MAMTTRNIPFNVVNCDVSNKREHIQTHKNETTKPNKKYNKTRKNEIKLTLKIKCTLYKSQLL